MIGVDDSNVASQRAIETDLRRRSEATAIQINEIAALRHTADRFQIFDGQHRNHHQGTVLNRPVRAALHCKRQRASGIGQEQAWQRCHDAVVGHFDEGFRADGRLAYPQQDGRGAGAKATAVDHHSLSTIGMEIRRDFLVIRQPAHVVDDWPVASLQCVFGSDRCSQISARQSGDPRAYVDSHCSGLCLRCEVNVDIGARQRIDRNRRVMGTAGERIARCVGDRNSRADNRAIGVDEIVEADSDCVARRQSATRRRRQCADRQARRVGGLQPFRRLHVDSAAVVEQLSARSGNGIPVQWLVSAGCVLRQHHELITTCDGNLAMTYFQRGIQSIGNDARDRLQQTRGSGLRQLIEYCQSQLVVLFQQNIQ